MTTKPKLQALAERLRRDYVDSALANEAADALTALAATDGAEAVFRERPTHHVQRGPESLPCYCWADTDHQIGAGVSTPPAPEVKAEAGFPKINPSEPTQAMINAGCAAWVSLYPGFEGEKPQPTAGEVAVAIYKAMRAATPPPEAGYAAGLEAAVAWHNEAATRLYAEIVAIQKDGGWVDSARRDSAEAHTKAASAIRALKQGAPDHA